MALKGIGFVLGKSIGKAFKQVGIAVGSGALVAGVAVLHNPEAVAPLIALGPYGLLAVIVLQTIGATAVDVVKHRNDGGE